jgi:hypothetical protein
MKERYGHKRKYPAIDKQIPIPPIHLVQCKPPMNYSPKGKEHTEGSVDKEINRMMESFSHGSIEYLNSKISRYSAQKGKCAVTGEFLEAHKVHAHHQKPKAEGGEDEYGNIIVLDEAVHRLVHATKLETVSEYLKNLTLAPKSMRTVNRLRKLAGTGEIMTKKTRANLKEYWINNNVA